MTAGRLPDGITVDMVVAFCEDVWAYTDYLCPACGYDPDDSDDTHTDDCTWAPITQLLPKVDQP